MVELAIKILPILLSRQKNQLRAYWGWQASKRFLRNGCHLWYSLKYGEEDNQLFSGSGFRTVCPLRVLPARCRCAGENGRPVRALLRRYFVRLRVGKLRRFGGIFYSSFFHTHPDLFYPAQNNQPSIPSAQILIFDPRGLLRLFKTLRDF